MSTYRAEPTSQNPSSGPRNPKAEAKAAKAYAKAMRPWYKKKRFIVPLGLVVLTIAGSAMSSAGSKSTTNGTGGASVSKSASSSPARGTDSTVGKVGQPVTNAGTTYEVTKVRTASTIGDPDLLGARADGKFVIVSLNLTNHKDDTKTFLESMAKLKTADGKEYDTSDKAVAAFGDKDLMLKDIQPDLTTSGKLAFEVPPSKVSGSTLVIQDIFGNGEVKVDLGL